MSMTFTYVASDGPLTFVGIPCRCPRPEDEPGAELCEHKRHELNVHNANGLAILRALGLPVEYEGEADPLDVLRALSSDAARELTRYHLTKLRDLCADAVQRHVRVGWA